MSISNAATELCKRDFADYSEEKRPKRIMEKTLPLMRTPVQKIYLNKNVPGNLPLSGISALSCFSMLAPAPVKSYAANKAYLKQGSEFQEASFRDDAGSILEVWHYSPIFGDENSVDKLSLYLSLKDSDDPRIEECLEEMMENIQW